MSIYRAETTAPEVNTMADPEKTEETIATEVIEDDDGTKPEDLVEAEHDDELSDEVEDDEISPGEEAFVRGYTSEREKEQKEE